MWQWYIHMPGLSPGYHAIRTVDFGRTLMTSSSDRQAGFFPSTIVTAGDLRVAPILDVDDHVAVTIVDRNAALITPTLASQSPLTASANE